MGQQGDDILYGEDGDDLLIGGSNVAGALDGDDVIDGGAGNDAIAGDNAECCFRYDLLDPRFQALLPGATTIYGTSIPLGNDGLALVSSTPLTTMRNDPTATGSTCNVAGGFVGCRQYRLTLLDHSDVDRERPAGPLGRRLHRRRRRRGRDLRPARPRRHPGRRHVDGLVFVASTYGTTASGPRPVLLDRRADRHAHRRLADRHDRRPTPTSSCIRPSSSPPTATTTSRATAATT